MSIDTIFSIREKIFSNIEINDKLIPDSKYKDIVIEIRKMVFVIFQIFLILMTRKLIN